MFVPGLISSALSCRAAAETDHAELSGGNGHGRSAEKTAAIEVDLLRTALVISIGGLPGSRLSISGGRGAQMIRAAFHVHATWRSDLNDARISA